MYYLKNETADSENLNMFEICNGGKKSHLLQGIRIQG